MYTEVLRSIDGIAIFPVVSLLVFVTIFAIVLVRVSRLDRSSLDRFAGLPLDPAESRQDASADGSHPEGVLP